MADTDGDGPDRTRKIKIRRAHRSSATRLCNSVYENIKAEVVNVAKLRQQRQSITEKVQTLAKLDGEMLDLVEEEALETEIEQADIVRERLTLCIIDIDEAIGVAEARGSPTVTLLGPRPWDSQASCGHTHYRDHTSCHHNHNCECSYHPHSHY